MDLDSLLTFWQSWRHWGENILVIGLIIEGAAIFAAERKRLEKTITAVGTLLIIVGVLIENVAGGHADDVIRRMRAPRTLTAAQQQRIAEKIKVIQRHPVLFRCDARS